MGQKTKGRVRPDLTASVVSYLPAGLRAGRPPAALAQAGGRHRCRQLPPPAGPAAKVRRPPPPGGGQPPPVRRPRLPAGAGPAGGLCPLYRRDAGPAGGRGGGHRRPVPRTTVRQLRGRGRRQSHGRGQGCRGPAGPSPQDAGPDGGDSEGAPPHSALHCRAHHRRHRLRDHHCRRSHRRGSPQVRRQRPVPDPPLRRAGPAAHRIPAAPHHRRDGHGCPDPRGGGISGPFLPHP